MNIQKVYILEDRGILYINGADANEFLQNMISNDINKVNEDNSCFACLLYTSPSPRDATLSRMPSSA